VQFLFWLGFLLVVAVILALDLGLIHRRDKVIHFRESLIWTGIYIALALLFCVGIYFIYEHHLVGFGTSAGMLAGGHQAALDFITGYLIEKSLSLDNIFVIAMIFTYFAVPLQLQHRVLFWGILGAVVLRGVMIGVGAALIIHFEWVMYVFGAILLLTAIKMARSGHEEIHPDRNPVVRLARRFFPVTPHFEGHQFFTRYQGKRAITPLFLALLIVESSDVLFAVDSVPAIFSVTRDPFIVFTSNIFAILGLRSLYFVLASLTVRFSYLRHSIVAMLAYIGVKMLLSHVVKIPNHVSLAVVAALLTIGILLSLRRPKVEDAL
jgi:tellurite resistance protein TerC